MNNLENFVGELQQICQRRHYQHPQYSFEAIEYNSGRIWIATVRVGPWQKRNAAPSKKLAKQKAAQHLVRLMRVCGNDFQCWE